MRETSREKAKDLKEKKEVKNGRKKSYLYRFRVLLAGRGSGKVQELPCRYKPVLVL